MRASDPLELVLQAERSANIQTWVPCRTANVLNHKANFPTPDSHSVNFTLELGVSWYFPMPSMPSIYSSFLCAVTNTVGPVL